MTARPWRLTRRQRVEMEAALSDLRSDFRACRHASGATARAVRVLARTSDDLAAVLFHNEMDVVAAEVSALCADLRAEVRRS